MIAPPEDYPSIEERAAQSSSSQLRLLADAHECAKWLQTLVYVLLTLAAERGGALNDEKKLADVRRLASLIVALLARVPLAPAVPPGEVLAELALSMREKVGEATDAELVARVADMLRRIEQRIGSTGL